MYGWCRDVGVPLTAQPGGYWALNDWYVVAISGMLVHPVWASMPPMPTLPLWLLLLGGIDEPLRSWSQFGSDAYKALGFGILLIGHTLWESSLYWYGTGASAMNLTGGSAIDELGWAAWTDDPGNGRDGIGIGCWWSEPDRFDAFTCFSFRTYLLFGPGTFAALLTARYFDAAVL